MPNIVLSFAIYLAEKLAGNRFLIVESWELLIIYSVVLLKFFPRKTLKSDGENVMTSVSALPLIMLGVYQISKQIKAHDGSVFTLCQMRNGMLLTGGGKDRKIILWDHDLNPEREIEVRMKTEHKHFKMLNPLNSCLLSHIKITYAFLENLVYILVISFPWNKPGKKKTIH